MSEFNEKLILVLIQYLVVGLIVVFAGYLFNRALEHYKTREAVAGEIAKQRVKVIAECWSDMYKWEATLESFIRKASELKVAHSNAPERYKAAVMGELSPVEASSKEQSLAVRAKVDESRFWLGEVLYAEFRDYSNRLMDYGTAFAEGNLSRFEALKAEIERNKGSLSKVLAEAF